MPRRRHSRDAPLAMRGASLALVVLGALPAALPTRVGRSTASPRQFSFATSRAQAPQRAHALGTLDLDTEQRVLSSHHVQMDPSNFATFASGPRVSARMSRVLSNNPKIFAEERERLERQESEKTKELARAEQANFVFDVGDMRDRLTTKLGRPPALFELCQALTEEGRDVRPSEMLVREKEGMKAINELFLANHRMVHLIVRKYVYATNLDQSDLVQEGNIGLLNAMRLFDPQRGVRFSTFASWHVRGTILRAIMNAHHTIRLPVRVQQEISAIQKEYKQLCMDEEEEQHIAATSMRNATADRIKWRAEALGSAGGAPEAAASSVHDRMVTAVADRLGWKREKVISRLHHHKTAQAISLDTPCTSGRGSTGGSGGSPTVMGDLISCPKSGPSSLRDDLEDVLLRDELRAVLDASTRAGASDGGRNSVIMRLHYGLEDGVEYTCAQIADMHKMSVSRVYSIIQHELCMLRRLYVGGRFGAQLDDMCEEFR
mmetsp:Transcript_1368/g.4341  ORF Transcript_1368/g.4341 Transcript_1368/m.4341 type:complete len:490 (+) Transcript_1368:125-1594(+)